MKHSDIKYNLL